jgi:hypothetical protein
VMTNGNLCCHSRRQNNPSWFEKSDDGTSQRKTGEASSGAGDGAPLQPEMMTSGNRCCHNNSHIHPHTHPHTHPHPHTTKRQSMLLQPSTEKQLVREM